jgi:TolA-binding protein
MEKEFTNLGLFDQYIQQELTVEETENFDQRLKEDKTFEHEFNLYQDMLLSIEYDGESEIRSTITAVQKKLKGEHFFDKEEVKIVDGTSRFKLPGKRWLAIAASILVFIVAGLYLVNTDFTNGSEDAFAKFYKPETNKLSGILDSLESSGFANIEAKKNKLLASALQYYEKGDYSSAGNSLTDFLKEYPADKTAQLYLGLNLLQQGNNQKAITQLVPLVSAAEMDYQSTAKWYLVLAYIQIDTAETQVKVNALLNQLVEENGDYTEEAKALLDKIK